MTSVLVMDDHAVVARGTQTVLKAAGFNVVALPPSGDLAAEVKRHYYKLYLIDLNMPQMDGLEATDLILDLDSEAKVLIYTGYENEIEPLFEEMVDRGVSGVISKSASIESLVAALRAALRDEVLMPMWLFRKLAISEKAIESATRVHFNHLEKDIMSAVISGQTNREIAKSLLIGQRTVEKYLTGIFQKLGVHSRVEAAEKINREGILLTPRKEPGIK
ncbi:response regulator transcription factor [Sporolactobacillus sp. THM19-2]|uniref:response regulator n=1 Tax=Sporolactobacillus sp. THM19-2 TaxID=2511171 RepID=UPI00101EE4C1|nr:response regulator transcription factor [Sporolactobacillus sp. THM19-2]RYL89803.1 response regulator transcription factor [Sporolactobacillus sp. THM19-2]